jgi:PadR family transcriptional regulator PadR
VTPQIKITDQQSDMNSRKFDTQVIVQRMHAEWKRGMLTYWVLGWLLIQPMYGLEIQKKIDSSTQGKMTVRPSTIYQLLRRLEQRGLVSSRWQQTPIGPPRAYYETTPAGRQVLKIYIDEVFSPGSPIANAMGEITAKLFQFFAQSEQEERP